MFDNAKWIWGSETASPDSYYDFALPFTVIKGNSYKLFLSCDSDYALYDGDVLLSFGQYPDYADFKAVECADLTDLREGEHLLTLTVWYQGVNCSTYIKKQPGVIFTLTENGEPLLSSSDKILCRPSARYESGGVRWITGQLGLSYAAVYNGKAEEYKSAEVLPEPNFNYVMRPVKKLFFSENLTGKLVACGGYKQNGGKSDGSVMDSASLALRAPIQTERGAEAEKSEGEDGVFALFDFGRETSGLIDLDFSVSDSCTALVGWGEHTDGERCDTEIGGRSFSCRLIAKKGENVFLPTMRRLGCRYLQIFLPTGRVTFHSAVLREISYPISEIPVKADTPLRKRIYDVSINTLRQCMHDHYEDCPWREQALYTFDSRNQMLCGYSAFRETDFARANLELISHGLRPDGLLSLCYPSACNLAIPAFSLAYVIQMKEYLFHTGDSDFIAGKYELLSGIIEKFEARTLPCGLVENFYGETGGYWNFYEWSDGMCGEFNDNTPSVDAPLNALFSVALRDMAQIADRLCRSDDADRFRRRSDRLNAALVREFYNSETSMFESFPSKERGKYSVLTNALCLLCGAADGTDRENILKTVGCNGSSDTGLSVVASTLSMFSFRYDALLGVDREKYKESILSEIDKIYGHMLSCGATSFWETIVGKDDFGGAGSLCHGWSALPVHYYSVLGAVCADGTAE